MTYAASLTLRERVEIQQEEAEDSYWAALDTKQPTPCYECGGPIVGVPVTDIGDQVWLPKDLWRKWCDEDCLLESADKAHAS